jgi:hypothetical protein
MKIYAIPGLGTNGEVFSRLKVQGHEIVSLHWPRPTKGITLEHYASLFKEQINTKEPFILMGLSFGGMLVVELSKLVSPRKTILISSCKTSADLPGIVKFIRVIPIHKLIPEKLFRFFQCYCGAIIGLEKEFRFELREMLVDIPSHYFRNVIHSIAHWENDEIPENCILIHGTSDNLVPFNKERTDYPVEGGEHAMIFSKAEEVSNILEKILN